MSNIEKKQIIEEHLTEFYDVLSVLENELLLKKVQISAIKSQIRDLEDDYYHLNCDDTNLDNIINSYIPEFNSKKNWPEDYEHENGNYICHCKFCESKFFGHKRRVMCKECTIGKSNI